MRHWKPDSVRQARKGWPAGATAGLLMVASACLGVAVLVYHVAGPRDVFERER